MYISQKMRTKRKGGGGGLQVFTDVETLESHASKRTGQTIHTFS